MQEWLQPGIELPAGAGQTEAVFSWLKSLLRFLSVCSVSSVAKKLCRRMLANPRVNRELLIYASFDKILLFYSGIVSGFSTQGFV